MRVRSIFLVFSQRVQLHELCTVVRQKPEVEQNSAEERGPFSVPVPDSLLSVFRSGLVTEQRADPMLSELFNRVLSEADGKSAAKGYLLKDELLVRKWMPHGETFVGNPVFQVVVLTKFRDEVLRTSHDQSGHLGVHKTYDYILRYFFWPRVTRDVSGYIKTCHTCQMTGKPNQTIRPAPLSPIPVVAQSFEHLIIDCDGPLPCSKSGSNYLLTVMCQSTRYPAAYPLLLSLWSKHSHSLFPFLVIRAPIFLRICLLKF